MRVTIHGMRENKWLYHDCIYQQYSDKRDGHNIVITVQVSNDTNVQIMLQEMFRVSALTVGVLNASPGRPTPS